LGPGDGLARKDDFGEFAVIQQRWHSGGEDVFCIQTRSERKWITGVFGFTECTLPQLVGDLTQLENIRSAHKRHGYHYFDRLRGRKSYVR
jgi:hypothetical protein